MGLPSAMPRHPTPRATEGLSWRPGGSLDCPSALATVLPPVPCLGRGACGCFLSGQWSAPPTALFSCPLFCLDCHLHMLVPCQLQWWPGLTRLGGGELEPRWTSTQGRGFLEAEAGSREGKGAGASVMRGLGGLCGSRGSRSCPHPGGGSDNWPFWKAGPALARRDV